MKESVSRRPNKRLFFFFFSSNHLSGKKKHVSCRRRFLCLLSIVVAGDSKAVSVSGAVLLPLDFSLKLPIGFGSTLHQRLSMENNLGSTSKTSDTWKDDKGFWSKLLKREEKICIKTMMSTHLGAVHKWGKVDRIRFVYLYVIAGLVIAKDEKKAIPVHYIKLVMDLEKLRAYPWDLHSFDYLVKSITNAKKDLKTLLII
ncbi:hypothetical protein ARALYDRAFT_900246 [Arabidopsis lyrata subsp. lyrata]|uniref:DUF1985 domain-containing protein n=1 Tax=Arabidopsis lyrata subsp. lyrata TaxID=81972 RepID=D7L089_ARALL|nr:hypothetical protein ARALYDRAFT_900246 [Arabidopsis lyrata subsp. lyrata]